MRFKAGASGLEALIGGNASISGKFESSMKVGSELIDQTLIKILIHLHSDDELRDPY